MQRWLATPRLAICMVACLALVTVVGLQTPAHSVGLRWVPGPRSRTLELIPLDLGGGIELSFGGTGDGEWPAWLTRLLVVLAAGALLVGLARWLRHRLRRQPLVHVVRTGVDRSPASDADARVLQSGLIAAIDILRDVRDPGNAVVRAWQELQDAAAVAGVTRHPAETASEFTARILYRSRGSTEPIAVLLALYHRVRFGEHTPSSQEISAAQRALVTLVDLWRTDLPERRPVRATRA